VARARATLVDLLEEEVAEPAALAGPTALVA
jgi:hypothetical protein